MRMMLSMLISLFTSREILRILGVEDFGTYNIVGSVVVLFSFVNSTMISSTQRFLNFEMGRKNMDRVQHVFSTSFQVQMALAAVVFILSETIGLWFLNSYVKIPDGRMWAANWVFQFSILRTIIRILRAPFNASIIAYEKMQIFAYVSILNDVLKLLIVYCLLLSSLDRLVTYSALGCVVSICISLIYMFYSNRHFPTCRIDFKVDMKQVKAMLSFSWWSLFGSVALLATFTGISFILNFFYGVAVNAALGVANQVYGAIASLSNSFQSAFNPQITKTYASGERNRLFDLIRRTSRYSFFLLIIFAIPIIIYCNEILDIWLSKVPEHSVNFCRLIILTSIGEALSGPLWMSVQATGNIKRYQIIISCILFMNLPLSALFIWLFDFPEIAIMIRVAVIFVAYTFRLIYLRSHIGLALRPYAKSVVVPCALCATVAFGLAMALRLVAHGHIHVIILAIVSFAICVTCIFTMGLSKDERKSLITFVSNKLGAKAA